MNLLDPSPHLVVSEPVAMALFHLSIRLVCSRYESTPVTVPPPVILVSIGGMLLTLGGGDMSRYSDDQYVTGHR